MGLFTQDIKTMNDLFVHQLQDIYYAENQLVKALPKMVEAARSEALTAAFERHLEETRQHVERLKQAFNLAGAPAKGEPCAGMAGLLQEGTEVMDEYDAEEEDVADAGDPLEPLLEDGALRGAGVEAGAGADVADVADVVVEPLHLEEHNPDVRGPVRDGDAGG